MFVGDRTTHQRHRGTGCCLNGAAVNDHAGFLNLRKNQVVKLVLGPVLEVLRLRDQTAGNQAIHVHLRATSENDARRVEQSHVAVCPDGAQDLARFLVEDAVHRPS